MRERPVYSIVDQTVDEALRKGTASADVEAMILLLKKYPLDAIDISLPHWRDVRIRMDQNGLQSLLRCTVRPLIGDIEEAGSFGFKRISVLWSHQPENASLVELSAALTAARGIAREVCLSLVNASCFGVEELLQYQAIINYRDQDRFIYNDQDSILEPFRAYRDLHTLQQAMPCPLEFHGHNKLGLATANTLAAIRAGIGYAGAAVAGVGLPGHAALEEVLMTTTLLWKQGNPSLGRSLAHDAEQVLARMGIEVAADKAIIGSCVFDHESGIHVDGIKKNPALYEAYQPEAVGLSRNTIIGKHSGTGALKQKFLHWHIALGQGEALQLLEQVREIATSQKGAVSDQQLWQLYQCNRARGLGVDAAAVEHPERGRR